MGKITILRDSREKLNHGWMFEEDDFIKRTNIYSLPTGDYTIRGYENDFIIERKGSTSEFANNIFEERFERELVRLEEFKHPFIVLEFSFEDLLTYPVNSGIPPKFWNKVKLNGKFLVSAFNRYQMKYKTKFILAGKNGMDCAKSLFKIFIKNVEQ